MIARIWEGRVPDALSTEYVERMRSVALPDYQSVPGNRGAWCLTRSDAGITHVTMLTFWEDMDAIRGFAGDAPEIAKYYDFDADYLLELPPHVTHHEIADA